MRGRLASIGAEESLLSEGWNLILTEPGACAVPHDIPLSAQLIPAPVPGTVAAGLEEFPHDAARSYAGLVPRYPCRRAMAADFDGAAQSRLDRQCLHPRRIRGEWCRPSQRVPA